MADSFLSSFPVPAASQLLGWKLIAIHPETQSIEVGFDGKPEFLNPLGVIQGGILTAMMDDTMGPLVPIFTKAQQMVTSIEIKVSFFKAAKPGPLRAVARIVQLGKTIAFLEAEIFDPEGQCLARATSSARVIATAKLAQG